MGESPTLVSGHYTHVTHILMYTHIHTLGAFWWYTPVIPKGDRKKGRKEERKEQTDKQR